VPNIHYDLSILDDNIRATVIIKKNADNIIHSTRKAKRGLLFEFQWIEHYYDHDDCRIPIDTYMI